MVLELLPRAVRFSVPDWIWTRPVLLNRTPTLAVLAGAVFCTVPKLLNPAVGPAKKLASPALSGITNRLPAWLFHTAALLKASELDTAMFVVPKLLTVRPSIFADVVVIVVPSFSVV